MTKTYRNLQSTHSYKLNYSNSTIMYTFDNSSMFLLIVLRSSICSKKIKNVIKCYATIYKLVI